MKKCLSTEEFIEAWQSAQSLQDFVKKTGIESNQARTRARYWRIKGVPLKKMVLCPDLEALKDLANKARCGET